MKKITKSYTHTCNVFFRANNIIFFFFKRSHFCFFIHFFVSFARLIIIMSLRIFDFAISECMYTMGVPVVPLILYIICIYVRMKMVCFIFVFAKQKRKYLNTNEIANMKIILFAVFSNHDWFGREVSFYTINTINFDLFST